MKVRFDAAIVADGVLSNYARMATDILEQEVRSSRFWETTSASWTIVGGSENELFLSLCVSNGSVKAERSFLAFKMKNRDYVLGEMIRLWGDFLEAVSHEQLRARRDLTPSTSHLDGDEALDRILDSVAEYSEREGHSPDYLKLPMRYATALMKLGPSYWGDFYRQIRESGLRAFDGQTLLGMRVELVPGIDAELQVA